MEKEKFKKQLEQYLNENSTILSTFTSKENSPNLNITVGFTKLIQDCQIEISETLRGLRVLINDEYPNKLIALGRRKKTFDVLMALFFFHELTHLVEQNLGMKHNVVGIRSLLIEGELYVLHFDVQADRKAIMMTRDMFPKYSELELTDIQTRSLEDFPTVKGYSSNSIIRKNRRFVANRMHHVIHRERFLIEELETPSNYVIVAWGNTGIENDFEFRVWLFGAQIKYLGVSKISEADNSFLDAITFESESSAEKFKKLDSLLERVLSNLHLGGGYIYRQLNITKVKKQDSPEQILKRSIAAVEKNKKLPFETPRF